MPLSQIERNALDETGYLILETRPDAGQVDSLQECIEELFLAEGDNAGAEFKQEQGCRRLANLVDKEECFRQAIVWPPLLECVAHVLGPKYKLSSANARSANPHSDTGQPLHADQGAVPDELGYWVCNSVWMLDDFTPDNGALRMIPGSHRWGKLPQDGLSDPCAVHPDEVLLTGSRGTVVVMNAHLWHAGTANKTAKPRTAFHAFFVRRDKPQQQYQKRLVRAEVQQGLSAQLRWLLALDDARNDELSRDPARRSGFLK